jgi:hypothetical protein
MEDRPRYSHRMLRNSKLNCGSSLQGHYEVSDRRDDAEERLERGEHIGIPKMNNT